MTLRRLKWISVLAPLVFLLVLDLARHTIRSDLLHAWPGTLLIGGVVLMAGLLFSEAIFGLIRRVQEGLEARNRELLALHQAALDVTSQLSLREVLQRVVDQARELAGARYGALGVLGEEGTISEFITSGLSPREVEAIGHPPSGRGLLGAVFHEGRPIRVREIGRDARSVGFPANHPPMTSFLGVPITLGAKAIGNLYLTDKIGAEAFSEEDEVSLERFATQAAIAISNARLHEQVEELAIMRERERIAREMHDRPAQLLGYVSTKAQAVQELLRRREVERAQDELESLIEAAQQAYSDVREDILALKTTDIRQALVPSLTHYLERLQAQSGIDVELRLDGLDAAADAGLSREAGLQLLRIIQEALSNVRKHAGVTEARVSLACQDDRLRAVVEDRGQGFDPAATQRRPHFGLSIMRERAESVGGSLRVESATGAGTRVLVEIPARRGGPVGA